MNKRGNYGGLDAFRILAAVLIVAIHTSPLTSFSNDADFFLTRIIARTAVPFFLMVTGQFVLPSLVYEKRQSTKRILRYILKVLVLYCISIMLYIPIGIYAGHYNNLTAGSVIKMLVFDGTFYHLWYFPACIIGVLLLFLFSQWMNVRGMIVATSILYLFGLLGDSYYGLTAQISVLETAYQWGFQIWSYTRNGLFIAPVFLLMGVIIGQAKRIIQRKYAIIGLLVSFLLLTAEAFALKNEEWQRHDSMYLMLIPVMFFLYQILLSLDWKPSALLRKSSTWIYILHPFIIVLVRGIAKFSRISILVDNIHNPFSGSDSPVVPSG